MRSDPILRREFLAGVAAILVLLPGRSFGSTEQRIVSVGGSVTETIYFLGREGMLVGADTTSSYPDAANDLPKVGYMRSLSVEGILSLEPTMILLEEGAGPPVALESLRSVGMRIEEIPDSRSIDDVVRKIGRVADLLGAEAEGAALAKVVSGRAAAIAERLSKVEGKPSVLFLLDIKDGALMTAGRNTSVEAIVAMAGGELVFNEFEGFRPVTAEAIQHADPDVILLMKHTGDRLGGEQAAAELPVLSGLRAAQAGRVVSIDGLLLLGFGPRTPDAVQLLARRLHGENVVPHLFDPLQPG